MCNQLSLTPEQLYKMVMDKRITYGELVRDKLDALELERVMRLLFPHGDEHEINLSNGPMQTLCHCR